MGEGGKKSLVPVLDVPSSPLMLGYHMFHGPHGLHGDQIDPSSHAPLSLLVSQRTNDSAEDHGRPETRNEEPPDVFHIKPVILVQGIDVWTLQPVAGCGQIDRIGTGLRSINPIALPIIRP